MMAVVLAGGKGTRLKPFTFSIPKPLLPLGNVPILEVVIRQLAAAGADRVALMLGHMAPLVQAAIGAGERFGLRIEHVIEEDPLGTAGPLRLFGNIPEDILVMNGDILTTLDYAQLMEAHRRSGAWGTITLSSRSVHIDYGVVETTGDSTLARYIEKPSIPYEVSMGINVLSRRCLDLIPEGKRFDMPQLMLAIRDSGHVVACQRTDCYWQDIGRFDDYQQASSDFVASPGRFLPGYTGGTQ